MARDYDLSGKVLWVTGAAQGFGRHFALSFARCGAAVAVTDVNLPGAEAVAKTIVDEGGQAIALDCDVADEAATLKTAAAMDDRFGGVDFLINNAGRHLLRYSRPFTVMEVADIRDLFDVNLMGAIFCARAALPLMRKRGGGAIVNIASLAGHMVTGPYGVSKLAVRGLTTALASELADDRIRVNAISPGLIATESAVAELPKEAFENFRDKLQLVHRRGEMGDITNAALFLCSDGASFITGETLKVTGGYPLYV